MYTTNYVNLTLNNLSYVINSYFDGFALKKKLNQIIGLKRWENFYVKKKNELIKSEM